MIQEPERPAARPDAHVISFSAALRGLAATVLFACLSAGAQDQDYFPADGSDAPKSAGKGILEAGTAMPIGSDFGFQPQFGGYLDFARSWQAGLQLRFSPSHASEAYDHLPQASVHIRKVWYGDGEGDVAAIRNSEYFGLAVGGFFGYGFDGEKSGLNPFGNLALGKYWMPFDELPYGLDLSIELTRYVTGHLPGRTVQVFIATGINVFYLLP
jgi:hypothetical protein